MFKPIYKYYAPVAPLPLIKELHAHGCLGSHVMLLAHDILEASQRTAYEEFFDPEAPHWWAQDPSGKKNLRPKVILDNSAAEQEKPVLESLTLAARMVKADTICLPDVLGNYDETVASVHRFVRLFLPGYRYNVMAIPQGSSIEQIMSCAHEIVNILGVYPMWGIPRWVANKFDTREDLIGRLQAEMPTAHNNIHLLGMSNNFSDDIRCARLPGVIGIDSANPLVLGQKHIDILGTDQTNQHPDRDDYWESKTLTRGSVLNIVRVRALIQGQRDFGQDVQNG